MGFTKIKFEDREIVLPFDQATGAQIKTQMGIPADRTLAIIAPSGEKDSVGDSTLVNLKEGDRIVDIPRHQYGAEEGSGPVRLAPEPFALQIGFRTPIRTLEELLPVLSDLHPREFTDLVFAKENRLAEWVETVLMLPELAEQLRRDSTRLGAIVAVDQWVRARAE